MVDFSKKCQSDSKVLHTNKSTKQSVFFSQSIYFEISKRFVQKSKKQKKNDINRLGPHRSCWGRLKKIFWHKTNFCVWMSAIFMFQFNLSRNKSFYREFIRNLSQNFQKKDEKTTFFWNFGGKVNFYPEKARGVQNMWSEWPTNNKLLLWIFQRNLLWAFRLLKLFMNNQKHIFDPIIPTEVH